LLLLLPLHSESPLDPVGLAFAIGAAACWAFYIIFGKRISAVLGRDAVAWGLLVPTLFILPLGAATAGTVLITPWVLATGLGIALLSSAIPYSLEMEALHRMPAAAFGIIASSAPAIGALIGFVILGERLTVVQWLAIACIIAASAGCAITAFRR
jgi:inner membrane transporter RhtA